MTDRLAAILRLGRISNLPTVWTNVIAAWFLAGGTWDVRIGWLCLAASLVYIAGCTWNDAFDAEFDRQHRTERPIPQGIFTVRTVGLIGAIEMAGGLVIFAFLLGAHVWAALILVIGIVLYDWWHKKSAWSVLLMAFCRFQLAVTVALAFAPRFHPHAWFFAGALFAYIVAVSMIARSEAVAEKSLAERFVPLRLLLHLPTFLALFLAPLSPEKLPIATMTLIVAAFIWQAMALWKLNVGGGRAVGDFVSRALAGICLFDAAYASIHLEWLAVVFFVAFLTCLLLQRRIAAT